MVTGKYADESLRFFKRLIRRKSDLLTFQQYGNHYAIKTYSFNGARDDTLYSQTITLGKGTILPKKCWFFCKKMLTLAKFRGSWYKKVYFLKLHKSVYSRTNFQISSIILTRFRRVCDLSSAKRSSNAPKPTQIRVKSKNQDSGSFFIKILCTLHIPFSIKIFILPAYVLVQKWRQFKQIWQDVLQVFLLWEQVNSYKRFFYTLFEIMELIALIQ